MPLCFASQSSQQVAFFSESAFGVKGFLESRLRSEDTFPRADGFGLAPSTPLGVAR